MSRFPLTPVQTALAAVLVLAVAVVVVVATSGLGPAAAVPTPTPSVAASPFPSAGADATPGATPAASPVAAGNPCVLPAVLPTPEPPDAAPSISTSSAALVFASYLLQRDPNGIVARDQTKGSWAVGLWFVAAGTAEARLLAAPEGGMVLPLAIAPQGDVVAAWWLPEHRASDEQACISGIYLVPVDGGPSVLVASGDWSVDPDGTDEATWTDPTLDTGRPRAFLLPDTSFSADGQFLALHEKDGITIHDRTGAQVGSRTGACPAVNWSATGARFVAGCDEFGTAWLFDATARARQELPIPPPPESKVKSGWEWAGARSIAWLDAERIETVRFYGYPTGCEVPGCTIPPPAYAVTTVNTATGAGKSIADELAFMADTSRLSPDGSWVYAQTWGQPGWTMELPFGALRQVKRPGTIVNGAANGSLLFSTRVLSDDSVRVFSIDSAGATHAVATIAWPAGTTRRYPVIWVGGLSAAVPAVALPADFATP
jgi:hypothetical protein